MTSLAHLSFWSGLELPLFLRFDLHTKTKHRIKEFMMTEIEKEKGVSIIFYVKIFNMVQAVTVLKCYFLCCCNI